ncbi:unnamed protein product, partial [Prorocentrum cordatum]
MPSAPSPRGGARCFRCGTDRPVIDCCVFAMSFCIAGISLAAGVGGGGLFVPLLMAALSFDTRFATAMSQSMLGGGAAAAFLYNIRHTHPRDPTRPLVDFELACLMAPALMSGAQIGSHRAQHGPASAAGGAALPGAGRRGPEGREECQEKVAQKAKQEAQAVPDPPNGAKAALAEEDSLGSSEEDTSTFDRADGYISEAQRNFLGVWLFAVVINLAKGILVDICTWPWWLLVLCATGCLGAFALHYARRLGGREPAGRGSLDFRELSTTIVRWSFLAGLLAAVCGIGGGMVMGPILVGLNVPPPISAATTATTLLVLSTSIEVVYIVRGGAPWGYSAFLFVATACGAMTGKVLIGRWVRRTGRDDIIVWCLAGITIVSMLLMGGLGLLKLIRDPVGAVQFNNMCSTDGIALESLADWHRIHDHGAPRRDEPPLRLLPYPSGHARRAPRLDCAHKQVERTSAHARGLDGKACGDEGWLQVEKLDDWFGKYGRPIAINSDVQRYASLVLRRPPNVDSMLQKKGGIPPLPQWAPYPETWRRTCASRGCMIPSRFDDSTPRSPASLSGPVLSQARPRRRSRGRTTPSGTSARGQGPKSASSTRRSASV